MGETFMFKKTLRVGRYSQRWKKEHLAIVLHAALINEQKKCVVDETATSWIN